MCRWIRSIRSSVVAVLTFTSLVAAPVEAHVHPRARRCHAAASTDPPTAARRSRKRETSTAPELVGGGAVAARLGEVGQPQERRTGRIACDCEEQALARGAGVGGLAPLQRKPEELLGRIGVAGCRQRTAQLPARVG